MVHRAAARISLRSREQKLRLFLELFRPGPETTVVDVGVTDAPFGGDPAGNDSKGPSTAGPTGRGSSDNFFEARYPWPESLTAVGNTGLDRFRAAFPGVKAVQADGRGLPFDDGAFALGFSNAVIEHVAGGREGQRQFIGELCRVAGHVFVTTPNRWFPIDPHTLVPFAHWLPDGELRRRLQRARGFDDVLDPLGPGELASLFPYPVKIFNRGLTLIAAGPLPL